jgi:23S rRNA G2445 N2-methylase RlmL
MKPEFGEDVDLPLTLSLYQDRAILYRDLSGASLHKRGYRDAMHKASLNEAVAAGNSASGPDPTAFDQSEP